jgi:hypothetical protein
MRERVEHLIHNPDGQVGERNKADRSDDPRFGAPPRSR